MSGRGWEAMRGSLKTTEHWRGDDSKISTKTIRLVVEHKVEPRLEARIIGKTSSKIYITNISCFPKFISSPHFLFNKTLIFP